MNPFITLKGCLVKYLSQTVALSKGLM